MRPLTFWAVLLMVGCTDTLWEEVSLVDTYRRNFLVRKSSILKPQSRHCSWQGWRAALVSEVQWPPPNSTHSTLTSTFNRCSTLSSNFLLPCVSKSLQVFRKPPLFPLTAKTSPPSAWAHTFIPAGFYQGCRKWIPIFSLIFILIPFIGPFFHYKMLPLYSFILLFLLRHFLLWLFHQASQNISFYSLASPPSVT